MDLHIRSRIVDLRIRGIVDLRIRGLWTLITYSRIVDSIFMIMDNLLKYNLFGYGKLYFLQNIIMLFTIIFSYIIL